MSRAASRLGRVTVPRPWQSDPLSSFRTRSLLALPSVLALPVTRRCAASHYPHLPKRMMSLPSPGSSCNEKRADESKDRPPYWSMIAKGTAVVGLVLTFVYVSDEVVYHGRRLQDDYDTEHREHLARREKAARDTRRLSAATNAELKDLGRSSDERRE